MRSLCLGRRSSTSREPVSTAPAFCERNSLWNRWQAGRQCKPAYLNKFTQANVKSYVAWLSTDRQGANTKITRNSYAIKTGAGGCADESTWRCAHTVVNELVTEIKSLMKNYPYRWRRSSFERTCVPTFV